VYYRREPSQPAGICMNLLSTLQHGFGFTRNEVKVVLLLASTFLVGVGIRWNQSRTNAKAQAVKHFDYAKSDSVFYARSRNTNGTDSPLSSRSARPTPREPLNSDHDGRPIDINTATKDRLTHLPGIGPAYAERIVQYRKDHGPFTSVEDLRKVSGIGKKRMDRLKGRVTVK
jgi:competence ComEA-like helix-hairpin-helix protein